jgi:hypothetical protein
MTSEASKKRRRVFDLVGVRNTKKDATTDKFQISKTQIDGGGDTKVVVKKEEEAIYVQHHY